MSGPARRSTTWLLATVLCAELSLGSAIVAEEWVEAHDLYGRNRWMRIRLGSKWTDPVHVDNLPPQ